MKRRYSTQPRIPGVRRVPVHSALLPQIEAVVQRDAARFGVSPSWVRAEALAHGLGIELDYSYKNIAGRTKSKTRRRKAA